MEGRIWNIQNQLFYQKSLSKQYQIVMSIKSAKIVLLQMEVPQQINILAAKLARSKGLDFKIRN